MRADGIVGLFPGAKFAIELGEGKRKGGDLVELLGMSAVGALDPAVEFGRAGRQDKELDAALLTGLLEAGRELAPAIPLQGPQRKGQTTLKGIEKQLGGRGGGSAMNFDHGPARYHIPRGELIQLVAGRRSQVEQVDLHQLAGLGNRIN